MNLEVERLNNLGFVEFCFNTILGREIDKNGAASYVAALNAKTLTREQVLIQFLLSEENKQHINNRELFPSGHYYSVIPSLEDRKSFLNATPLEDEIPGISLNSEGQLELLGHFLEYYPDCPFQELKNGTLRYCYENPSYSYTDALTLYSMIREYKPKRVIEIGSGYSSCAMLDTSELFFDGTIDFTFIEPYPDLLNSLLKIQDKRYLILPKKLQDVDGKIFSSLEASDILFVDSTHVSKLGSDVNRILFEILPNLNKGVLIDFHDIFWPFEYPLEWIKKGIAWNEAYLLRAFLEYNDRFEIKFFSSYLHRYHHEWFKENMPLYLKNTGGNFWLIKK